MMIPSSQYPDESVASCQFQAPCNVQHWESMDGLQLLAVEKEGMSKMSAQLHMLLSLLYTFLHAAVMVCISLPRNVLLSALATLHPTLAATDKGATFYEGTVRHVRRSPKRNSFTLAKSLMLCTRSASSKMHRFNAHAPFRLFKRLDRQEALSPPCPL